MANPQLEDGYLSVANELAEAFARVRLSGTQWQVLWVVIRKTYGWQKKSDTIGMRQFMDATGLHKNVVSREVARLVARSILREQGDDYHPKRYELQKDYARWQATDAPTPPQTVSETANTQEPTATVSNSAESVSETADTRAETVSSSVATVSNSVDELLAVSLTTKDSKDTTQKTRDPTAHAVAADSAAPGSLRDRFAERYRIVLAAKGNTVGVIGELFAILFPGHPPQYERLGKMLKRLNSGGRLIDIVFEAAKQRITDDPHDYIEKLVGREARKEHDDDGDERRNSGGAGNGRGGARGERAPPHPGRAGGGGGHRTYRDGDFWGDEERAAPPRRPRRRDAGEG